MAWIGAVCGDMGAASLSDSAVSNPFHGVGTVQPGAMVDDISANLSKHCWFYYGAVGGPSSSIFESIASAGTWWFYLAVNAYEADSTVGSGTIFYSAPDADGAYGGTLQTGTVRVVYLKDGTNINTGGANNKGQYGLRLDWYDGAAWIIGTGTLTNVFDVGTTYYWTLSIQRSNGSTGIITLDVDGVNKCTEIPTINVLYRGMFAIQNTLITGKGGAGYLKWKFWEILCNDDQGASPTTKQTYSGAGSGYHCILRLPDADGDSNAWTPTGSCDGSRWRTLTDGFKNYTEPVDYIAIVGPSGADQDQLVGMGAHGSSAMGAVVYYCPYTTESSYVVPTDIIAKESGGSTVLISAINNTYMAYLYRCAKLSPAGSAWTGTIFDGLQAGVRRASASGDTMRVNQGMVAIIGTGLSRPSLIGTCPARQSLPSWPVSIPAMRGLIGR